VILASPGSDVKEGWTTVASPSVSQVTERKRAIGTRGCLLPAVKPAPVDQGGFFGGNPVCWEKVRQKTEDPPTTHTHTHTKKPNTIKFIQINLEHSKAAMAVLCLQLVVCLGFKGAK
jgi:hypothetical protein